MSSLNLEIIVCIIAAGLGYLVAWFVLSPCF